MLNKDIVQRFEELNIEVGEDSQGYYTIYKDNQGWTYPNTIENFANVEKLMDYLYKQEDLKIMHIA